MTTQSSNVQQLCVEALESRMMLSTVDIVAAGATGEETVELRISGETVAVFENVGGDFDNREFVTLTWETPDTIDTTQVEIAFTNDLYDPANGVDRNVLVDRVMIRFSDGTPEERPFAQDQFLNFQAEDQTVFSTGTWRPEDGVTAGFGRGEVLHANGVFKLDGTPLTRGFFAGASMGGPGKVIQINARGETGEERLDLLIDDQLVQSYDVTTELREYRFVSNQEVTADRIRIEFNNDFYDPANGVDRNLTVSSIRLDFDFYQTESPDTFVSGAYVEGEGISSGFLETETLHANGFIEFLDRELDGLDFAGRTWFPNDNATSNLVTVSDGQLFIRGIPGTSTSVFTPVELEAGRRYRFSVDSYRQILSGNFGTASDQPFATVGIDFINSSGQEVGKEIIEANFPRDEQSLGLKEIEFVVPHDTDAAYLWIWAQEPLSRANIPLVVRDIGLVPID